VDTWLADMGPVAWLAGWQVDDAAAAAPGLGFVAGVWRPGIAAPCGYGTDLGTAMAPGPCNALTWCVSPYLVPDLGT
jgi:hypothetical protein